HKILYKQIDKVIVAGKNSARDLLLTHPISESQVALLPYGLDTHRFDNITDHRKKFSIQENDLFLGVFARIDRQKGIKELLLAIQSLISEGLSIKALFMGDKTIGDPDAVAYQNEIQEIMKDEVLQKNVTFKGFQRDYLGYVNSVDLMVLPSYKETYALTILDAFYLKKPVLSTNAGGTPELVSTERGWLALPKSTPSLAEKLKEIYAQKQTLQTKGQNAHDYICKNHVFSAVLTKLEEIYTQ
ncbi:MAG: glycosyltransferase family 4 protein, partial [Bdellovibrionales bacterium]|nr:glycosyltransferase family 4 protein [Bdellovibrionales bacterium]